MDNLSSPRAWTSVIHDASVKLLWVDMLLVLQASSDMLECIEDKHYILCLAIGVCGAHAVLFHTSRSWSGHVLEMWCVSIPSLTLSSFLSNFAIDMGGNNFGDREVICIGDSSLEDTCHGVSKSESFSSERLRVSRRTGGDTSCLRRRAQPSHASPAGDLIPITMILPHFTFGGVEKSGGGDVRVFPRVRCSHSVGSPSSLPIVLGLVLPLTAFQCALLEHLNVTPSQLHPNSWAMVRAFKILCLFFNIRPISLNNMSKKLFKFSNVFCRFKDYFFKVLATDVVVNDLPLMFKRDREPRFLLFWQSDRTNSLWPKLTFVVVVVACFAGIMGDFPWRPLVKQVGPLGGTVSLSAIAIAAGERSQLAIEVGLVAGAFAFAVVVVVTPTPPPPLVVLVQEATPTTEVDAPAALASPIVSPSFTVATSLLSVGVVTMSAPMMPPPFSLTPLCWHRLPPLFTPYG
ncbi:hypothetical protein HKD37_08G022933 [Glycine soja]